MYYKLLEFVGSFGAILGAGLIACDHIILGYISYIISGLVFIPWAIHEKAKYFLIMQVILGIIVVYGLTIRVI